MINIAIDGHVGSGKSTLAKALAKKLGFKVFDTGAIYRALACEFASKNFGEPNQKTIDKFVKNLDVRVTFVDGVQHVLVNGNDYADRLRLEETSVLSAKVAPYPILRKAVLEVQRDFAQKNNVVMEGRDIATNVLPNADFKFFVTASEEVRAKRRFDQFAGNANAPTYEQVLQDLRQRDFLDEHREVAPLKPAADSIIIDNSNLTLEQTIEKCYEIVKNHKNLQK